MAGTGGMGRLMVFAGAVLILAGALLLLGGRIPWLGRLPGDITIERGGYSVYLPVATSIILSIVLSLILWLVGKK